MIHGRRIAVVLPAYNAARTLKQTVEEIPRDYIDDVILVDDASHDDTAALSRALGLHTVIHARNAGYGANQKTCYREALERGAEVVIMLHPDYQYTPKLLVAMGSLVAIGQFDIVLGSRILAEGALKGGMPLYKYISNRFLTLFQNLMLGRKLSEYHTGYRAFSKRVLETLPLEQNADGFIFDNQMLAQALYLGFSIGEVSCPARYFPEASSVGLGRSLLYGLGVVATSIRYRLNRWGILRSPIFKPRKT